MLKRNTRLRKYLYRNSLEGKERLIYEKKRKIREALQEGKPIPTELRNEEAVLLPRTHIDDEYAKAAKRYPKTLITTSRNPSAPLLPWNCHLQIIFFFFFSQTLQVTSEIIETCWAHDFTDVVLVHEIVAYLMVCL
ncbi:unnamed protein product [Prunus brigantina]